ncbi:hypothetical protein C8J57DRAFT_1246672 [Mycena rebaudengoi]|nr:hypothetical protein C8J57DRAFT_1246672 [Mycena rebaudengoi]
MPGSAAEKNTFGKKIGLDPGSEISSEDGRGLGVVDAVSCLSESAASHVPDLLGVGRVRPLHSGDKTDPPSLSEAEHQLIADLCQDALFAAWNEDSTIEDVNYKLRQLWKTAVHMGFAHGQKEPREAIHLEKQTRAAVAKELEQERVWGFDVGRRLERAFQASKEPSSPFSTPTVSVSTQTDDASAPPIHPASLPPPPPPPDLSLPSPFLTSTSTQTTDGDELQTANWADDVRQHSSHSKKADTNIYLIQSTPPASYHSAPRLPPSSPFTSVKIPTQLDWDRDPHLRDLGRALTALGWVRGIRPVGGSTSEIYMRRLGEDTQDDDETQQAVPRQTERGSVGGHHSRRMHVRG